MSDETPNDPEISPLEALHQALQTFVNIQRERPVLVDHALIVWEEVGFGDDGETERRVSYCVPTDNFSLSGTVGLLEAAGIYVRRDVFGHRDEES